MDKPFHVYWKSLEILHRPDISKAAGSTAGLGPRCLVNISSNMYSKPSFSSF